MSLDGSGDAGNGNDDLTVTGVDAGHVIALGREGNDPLDFTDTVAAGEMIVHAGADRNDIRAGTDCCIDVETRFILGGSGGVPPRTCTA